MKCNKTSEDFGIILCADCYYISVGTLSTHFSIPAGFVQSVIVRQRSDLLVNFDHGHWISYDDLPDQIRDMHLFPTRVDLYSLCRQNGNRALFKEDVMTYIKRELLVLAVNSAKHSILFLKKTRGTRNFPVLKACRSYAVLTRLSEHKMLSNLMRFLLYLSVADESFLFVTRSLYAFQTKYYKFLKEGADSLIHKNCLNTNACKVGKHDRDFLLACHADGNNLSFSEIMRRLNATRISRGEEHLLSRSTVRRFLQTDARFGIATLAREGADAIDKILGNALRESPHFAGDRYQIDGTRFNILYKNDAGRISFLCMVVVLDIYSKKVVGYSLSPTESFANYITGIRMSVKSTGFLPAEILTDNFTSGSNTVYKSFVDQLTKLGTSFLKHKPRKPQVKGSVENWFHLFGEMYLKGVNGYLGDGLKSKNKNGKPNSDLIAQARKRKNIRTEADLAAVFADAIIRYNSTYAFKNSTPNNLFAESYPQNAIRLDEHLLPLVYMEWGTRTISSRIIQIIKDDIIYQYIIYDKAFLLKYLRQKVAIRYHKFDHSEILIYELNGIEILLKLTLHKRLVEAAVNRSPQDDIEMYDYAHKRDKLEQELKDEVKAFKKLICHIPLEAVHHKVDSKALIEASADAYLQTQLQQQNKRKPASPRKTSNDDHPRKTVKIKSLVKAAFKTSLNSKESTEKILISFNDLFRETGSGKPID